MIDMMAERMLFGERFPYGIIGEESTEELAKEYANYNCLSPVIDGDRGVLSLADDKRMFYFAWPEL